MCINKKISDTFSYYVNICRTFDISFYIFLFLEVEIYKGCNIENSNFVSGCCAEKTAFVKAISEGETKFDSIAIVGGKENIDEFCLPCGSCRQIMNEFCDKDFKIYVSNNKEIKVYTLEELLPYSFNEDNLHE